MLPALVPPALKPKTTTIARAATVAPTRARLRKAGEATRPRSRLRRGVSLAVAVEAARSAAVPTISGRAVGSTSARSASISSSLTIRRPFSSRRASAAPAGRAAAAGAAAAAAGAGVSRRAGGVAGSPGRTAGRTPAPTRATARESAAGSVRSAYASSAPEAWTRAQARRLRGAAARYVETASWAVLTSSGVADGSSPRRARSVRSSLSGLIALEAAGALIAPLPPGAPIGRVLVLRASSVALVDRPGPYPGVTPAPKCRVRGQLIPSAGRHKCACLLYTSDAADDLPCVD